MNKYNSPCLMSDGRSFTDYRPRCIINYELLNNINIDKTDKNTISSYEMRMYLQKNAENIMKKDQMNSINNFSQCKRPLNDSGTMYPEKNIVTCDAISCTKKTINEFGLGDGREYFY